MQYLLCIQEETQVLNYEYTEINSSMQKQSAVNSRIFAVDDDGEYAKLNLRVNQDKVSTAQVHVSQTVEKGMYCIAGMFAMRTFLSNLLLVKMKHYRAKPSVQLPTYIIVNCTVYCYKLR